MDSGVYLNFLNRRNTLFTSILCGVILFGLPVFTWQLYRVTAEWHKVYWRFRHYGISPSDLYTYFIFWLVAYTGLATYFSIVYLPKIMYAWQNKNTINAILSDTLSNERKGILQKEESENIYRLKAAGNRHFDPEDELNNWHLQEHGQTRSEYLAEAERLKVDKLVLDLELASEYRDFVFKNRQHRRLMLFYMLKDKKAR